MAGIFKFCIGFWNGDINVVLGICTIRKVLNSNKQVRKVLILEFYIEVTVIFFYLDMVVSNVYYEKKC